MSLFTWTLVGFFRLQLIVNPTALATDTFFPNYDRVGDDRDRCNYVLQQLRVILRRRDGDDK